MAVLSFVNFFLDFFDLTRVFNLDQKTPDTSTPRGATDDRRVEPFIRPGSR